jgi:hypothetical protein
MKFKKFFTLTIGSLILLGLHPHNWRAEPTEPIEAPVRESIEVQQKTQKREEAWRMERDKMMTRYDRLEKERDVLLAEVQNTRELIRGAESRIRRKKKELSDIEQISHDLQPYLTETIEGLKQDMTEGLPFLTVERRERMDRLSALMADPEISISEKYRKVMEAMLIEADYGYTTEVTQEMIAINNEKVFADSWRRGRLNLFFIRPDGNACGFYNMAEKRWIELPPDHLNALKTATEISARRQTATLLDLPIGRIVTP